MYVRLEPQASEVRLFIADIFNVFNVYLASLEVDFAVYNTL